MARLAVAREEQIDAIYRESFALWGAGLSFRSYREFWDELSRTPWARAHLHFLVWTDDDGSVLSSLKLYCPQIRIGDRVGRAAGIGAVFTPRPRRKRGHASRLISAVLEESRERGDLAAILFSDVGTSFYRDLGFAELPAEEVWGQLPGGSSEEAAGWTLRPLAGSDLHAVMDAQAAVADGRDFAIVRDRPYWEYLLERSRCFFARLDGSDLSHRFQVAARNGAFGGYLVSLDSGDVWIVREVVAGSPEESAAVLRAGAAQARARGMRRFYAWLGRSEVDAIPEFRTRVRRRRRAIPMVRPLDGSAVPASLARVESSFVPYLDQF